MSIYIIKNGERNGPFTFEQVVELTQKGECLLTDLGWREGLTDWTPLHAMPDVVEAVVPPLPSIPQEQASIALPPPLPKEAGVQAEPSQPIAEAETKTVQPTTEVSPEARLWVLLMCFFLGGLGIHAFYVQRPGRGVVFASMFVLFWIFTSFGNSLALLLAVGLTIFGLLDVFNIALGRFQDGQGRIIKKWL